MAATQYSDYYGININSNSYQYGHHHQSQQQNFYGYATGQFDCKNLNVNEAYNNNTYNYTSPNNYADPWMHHYNAIAGTHQLHQTQPHYHTQHLNMLNNQINDDYENYSHPSYNNSATASKVIPSTTHQHPSHHPSNGRNEQQPNLNCNQYVDRKNDLYYGQQPAAAMVAPPSNGEINEAIASSYPSSQLTESSKKRKIDNSTASADDSPALRALLTKPAKRAKCSPYFYHSQGSISPASSTECNYPQHYQLPSVPVVAAAEEQLVNLNHYNQTKEGYEPSIDDIQLKPTTLDGKYSAASLFAPSSEATNSPMSFMENISTPPSSPKDLNGSSSKHDESSENLLWNDQNGGLLWLAKSLSKRKQ